MLVKNEKEAFEKIMRDDRNNDYTTANLLDFAYFKKKYSLIGIDLCKQTKLKDPLQISFIGRFFSCTRGKNVFYHRKSEETSFELLQNSANI